jgi:hypothetical protein
VTAAPDLPGDVNHDNKYSIADLAMAAAHYVMTQQHPDWNKFKSADVDGNGVIDTLRRLRRKLLKPKYIKNRQDYRYSPDGFSHFYATVGTGSLFLQVLSPRVKLLHTTSEFLLFNCPHRGNSHFHLHVHICLR